MSCFNYYCKKVQEGPFMGRFMDPNLDEYMGTYNVTSNKCITVNGQILE